jgi:hypothetical protein
MSVSAFKAEGGRGAATRVCEAKLVSRELLIHAVRTRHVFSIGSHVDLTV